MARRPGAAHGGFPDLTRVVEHSEARRADA